MKKFIKISLICLTILLLVFAGGGWYFSSQIKPILKQQISDQLAVKVEVSDITISSILDFPKLGLTFKQVKVHESADFYHQPVLDAEELSLYVNILKLINKEYVIDGITLKNGTISLADMEDFSNYEILKEDSSGGESVDFAIKDIEFNNCQINYQHLSSGFKFSGLMKNSHSQLNYLEDNTKLSLAGTLYADSITQGKDSYIKEQEAQIESEIEIRGDSVIIHPSQLQIAAVKLSTQGVVTLDKGTGIDLIFSNEAAPLASISTILPSYIQKSMDHMILDGNTVIKGFFKGTMDEKNFPAFGFKYELQDGTIGVKGESIKLDKVKSSGELRIPNLGNLNSAWAQVKLDKAVSGNNALRGDIHVDNFNRPLIKWAGDASLDAVFISALMDDPDLKLTGGRIQSRSNLQLRYDINKEEVVSNSFKFNGNFKGQRITGKIKDPELNITALNFDLKATENKIAIKQCKLDYNESSAEVIGYILNANAMFNPKSNTEIVGKLTGNNLNISDFYKPDTSSTSVASSGDLFPFKIALNTEINNLVFNEFKASSLKGMLRASKNNMRIDDAQIDALEGHIKADLKFGKFGENYLMDINSIVSSVNITELFRQFNEFDQKEITSQHISGDLSGKILAKIMLDENFEPILDKLYAKGDIEIIDGQLVNYEPLKELSSFVEVSELENVKFNSLKNTIEIFDGTIFIPKMFIGNSALSLDIGGTHTFENYMNYKIEVNLAEVLSNKTNWLTNRKERIIDKNSLGGLTAHITMKGTPDDLEISYDKKSTKEAIDQEVRTERQSLINALRGEKDTVVPEDYYDDLWDE